MRVSLFVIVMFVAAATSRAADVEPVDYVRQVKPLLAQKCYACHGALKQQAGLRLDTASLAIKGGESGVAVQPGKADQSLLLQRLVGKGDLELMPPEGQGERLTAEQVALVKAWIAQGAKAPDEPVPPDPREHWSFQPPTRPTISKVKAAWSHGPIDAFVASKQEEHGLTAVSPASKSALLRRVYLDLIGLPPTRAQLHAFLNDSAADAYEKVVEQLLDSPRYGERWGRHWMDVWRYTDHYGLGGAVRNSQKHIWHWRDWIIESVNNDKPYDRLILEMLAGDEIAPADMDVLRGTGYLARNYYVFNRSVWLNDIIEHTSKAFLGLTFNCARCHDHKYDPLTQNEYFQMRAFFEPHRVRTDRLPGQADIGKDGLPRVYDSDAKVPTYFLIQGDDLKPDKNRTLEPRLPALLEFGDFKIQAVSLPVESFYPGFRSFAQDESVESARAAVAKAEAAFTELKRSSTLRVEPQPETLDSESQATKADEAKRDLALAEKELAAARAHALAVEARLAADRAKYASPPAERAGELAMAAGQAERLASLAKADLGVMKAEDAVLSAKAALKPKDKKTADALAASEKKLAAARKQFDAAKTAVDKPSSSYTPFSKTFPATSTGRRTMLASWITDTRNPLTARVAVNHIWLRHFGEALVPSVFDFGRNGQRPSHPQLLDWLAVEFMESGWSMKHLHRLIVKSSTYRRSSSTAGASESTLTADPDNRFLWMMNPRRMDAPTLRDSILFVAGELDLKMGGSDIDPANSQKQLRRSVYFRHSRDSRIGMLKLFDDAKVEECYRRTESIVPQQALAMANSKLVLDRSRRLAAKLQAELKKAGDDSHAVFVTAAFETVLSRSPTDEELAACQQALAQFTHTLTKLKKANPATRARENLVHVLMNHNDFIAIR